MAAAERCDRCGLLAQAHLAYNAPVDTPNLYESPGWSGLYCPPETGRPHGPPSSVL